MRTLYIDCPMGCAGDMLTAALLELLPDKTAAIKMLNDIHLNGVEFFAEDAEKCGIRGTHLRVTVHGEEEGEEHSHEHGHHHENEHHHEHTHSHNDMHGIEHIVNGHLNVPDKVKTAVLSVYKLIAEAESKVHGVSVDEIHFHEVGNLDAIADITAAALFINMLKIEKIVASPVNTGKGTVKCAHGILPVPAPATAELLTGIPCYCNDVEGELCTPTGAALLKYFADDFGNMPVMTVEKIGYGMGKKDFPVANCVRCILGETRENASFITELKCNIDDMTAEEIGFAQEHLLQNGAVEVYTVNIGMKKSRPGVLLCVMCPENRRDEIVKLIFRHTTTIGIRESVSKRYTLERRMETVATPLGEIRKKTVTGYGVTREKFEYDDCAAIAGEKGISLREVRKIAEETEKEK